MKEYQVQIKSDHSKGLTFTAASPQKERGMWNDEPSDGSDSEKHDLQKYSLSASNVFCPQNTACQGDAP